MTETTRKHAIPARDYSTVQKDWRVCITGIGVDNFVHTHATVTDVTKIYIKSKATLKSGSTVQYRHRRDTGKSVPYSPYGGTQLNTTCARRKG